MSEFVYWQGDEPVTSNPDAVTGPTESAPSTATSSHVVTGCGCDLERRIKVRMAEAEDAAQHARMRGAALLLEGSHDSAELTRLTRLALTHEQLAEALGAVLEGGF